MAIWLTKARTPDEQVRRILDPIRQTRWWWLPLLLIPFNAPIFTAIWYGFAERSAASAGIFATPDHLLCLWIGPPVMCLMMRTLCFELAGRRVARLIVFPVVGLLVAAGCLVVAAGTLTSPEQPAWTRVLGVLTLSCGHGWRVYGAAAGVFTAWSALSREWDALDRVERLWQQPLSPERVIALNRVYAQYPGLLGERALVDPSVWLRQLAASAELGSALDGVRLFAQGVPRYRDLPEALTGLDAAARLTENYAGPDGVCRLLKYVQATCGWSAIADEAERRFNALVEADAEARTSRPCDAVGRPDGRGRPSLRETQKVWRSHRAHVLPTRRRRSHRPLPRRIPRPEAQSRRRRLV